MGAESIGHGLEDTLPCESKSMHEVERFEAEMVTEHIPEGCPRVLGIGIGRASIEVAARGIDLIYMDRSRESLELCRRRVGDAPYVQGDLEAGLPFPDASFDYVYTIHVFRHVKDLDAALREVNQALRPGGYFVFSIPNRRSFGALSRRQCLRTTRSELIKRLHANGFDQINIRGGPKLPQFLYRRRSEIVSEFVLDVERALKRNIRSRGTREFYICCRKLRSR